ncbi:unnamed protein product, partial [marine sediment metagenome]
VLNPKGGARFWSGAQTGVIQIQFPTWDSFHAQLTLDVFERKNDKAFRLIAAGRTSTGTTWNYTTAKIIGTPEPDAVKVRFARNPANDKWCILIGETTTVWASYLFAAIVNVASGYGQNIDRFKEGWDLSIVNDLTGYNIDRTIADATIAPEAIAAAKTDAALLNPSGMIIIWHGTIATIPSGWIICDGNSGTPNLLDRFIESVPTAATNPGATGGATAKATSGHIHTQPTHKHTVKPVTHISFEAGATINNAKDTQVTSSASGDDNTGSETDSIADIRPKYYDAAFLMKT